MNFSTRKLNNDKMMFVYADGQAKETDFRDVQYKGGKYVLALKGSETFYTLLDLDGNEAKNIGKVIHTFANGYMLTYMPFEKKYGVSTGNPYAINYNVYKMVNPATGKSYIANVVQSESLLAKDGTLAASGAKQLPEKFLNKEMFCFDNIIFSEPVEDKYVLTASLIAAPGKGSAGFDFGKYSVKKIWGVTDCCGTYSFNGQADFTVARPGITFVDAEAKLFAAIDDKESIQNHKNEQDMYTSHIRKSRWNSLIDRLIDFNKI